MAEFLLFSSIVLMICLVMNKLADRLPVPSLIFFLVLGMVFGENGIFKIYFNDYRLSEVICSVALVFIMFYGGFGTNFKQAKKVAIPSFVLSTFGVVLTAGLVGVFVHFLFGMDWLYAFLVGSVIASTDAASVFNVLRSKNLALKYHTDSMLELESGSNDPVSYMLTMIFITLISGESVSLASMIFLQIILSIVIGLLIGKLAVYLLNQPHLMQGAARTIFLLAISMLAYALPSYIDGNGYLSVYLCGILIGNSFIPKRKEMVQFFDVLTENCQMLIFFLLGLLVTPLQLGEVFIPAFLIMLFLTFVARPIAVGAILLPFRARLNQIGVVSWAGFRGVASIVFSIYVVLADIDLEFDIFNLVFVIVLLSLVFQGTLLPYISKWLNMDDENANVFYTFNDYRDENDISFVKIRLDESHEYTNKKLSEVSIPKGMLVALIVRDHKWFVPNGNTLLLDDDLLVIAAKEFSDKGDIHVYEVSITANHKWKNKELKSIGRKQDVLIVALKRNDKMIVPDGNTKLLENDVVVIANG